MPPRGGVRLEIPRGSRTGGTPGSGPEGRVPAWPTALRRRRKVDLGRRAHQGAFEWVVPVGRRPGLSVLQPGSRVGPLRGVFGLGSAGAGAGSSGASGSWSSAHGPGFMTQRTSAGGSGRVFGLASEQGPGGRRGRMGRDSRPRAAAS